MCVCVCVTAGHHTTGGLSSPCWISSSLSFFSKTQMKNQSESIHLGVRSFRCLMFEISHLFFLFLLLFFLVGCLFVFLFVFVTSTQQLLSIFCQFFPPFLKTTIKVLTVFSSNKLVRVSHMQLHLRANMKTGFAII